MRGRMGTYTPDEARAAGRARALAGGTPFPTDPGIVASDELRRAWCEGYRAGQVHDPACPRCRGTGTVQVAPGETGRVGCDCNLGVDEDDEDDEDDDDDDERA